MKTLPDISGDVVLSGSNRAQAKYPGHWVRGIVGVCFCLLMFQQGWAQGSEAYSAQTAAYFKTNCTSCHTIGGGRLAGPDLKNATQRKDREWHIRFIQNPKAVIDQGDAYAVKLVQDYGGVIMPTGPGMTRQLAEALVNLIEAESKADRSVFSGAQMPERPFTPADVARGQAIFLGEKALLNGGPSCFSCHAVSDIGLLGGGRLGPDLTRAYERLQGRTALAAWLSAPATPMMQKTYGHRPLDPEEVLALSAFLQASVERGKNGSAAMLNFFLFGLGGAFVGLVLFDLSWRRRLRSVRRSLVRKDDMRGVE